MSRRPTIRCAIYTRKSSEEGLDQEFNSLDAQHEACAAYIASQRHEGWKLLPARYDDGGLSGGTLERPALQQLMRDIEAGGIEMVVVYKIDRLTRSLADFARLVETLEAAGCSFVSVTQAFNTSSSMGRLTLNVLLSFAQFEREVTAERIRDKLAASKKKGLWMGGNLPLGYDRHPDPQRQELVPNEREAEVVRALFELYDRHGCLKAVECEADRRGLRSKYRVSAAGKASGGTRLSRGQIHHLLRNPVYLGRIRHKETSWPGQHDAIVDAALWDRVQQKMQAASARPRGRAKARTRTGEPHPAAPLTGKLRDETGDRLTPTHTTRNGRRLRYYISHRLITEEADPRGWRLPAQALENTVASLVADHVTRAARAHRVLSRPDATTADAACTAAIDLATRIREEPSALHELIANGAIGTSVIGLELDRQALARALHVEPEALSESLLRVEAPFTLRRRGMEARIVAGDLERAPDEALVAMLARAHRWADALRSGTPLSRLAQREKVSDAFLRTRVRPAFLAPRIQAAILAGTQPPELTVKALSARLPLDWDAQEEQLGFTS